MQNELIEKIGTKKEGGIAIKIPKCVGVMAVAAVRLPSAVGEVQLGLCAPRGWWEPHPIPSWQSRSPTPYQVGRAGAPCFWVQLQPPSCSSIPWLPCALGAQEDPLPLQV